MESIAYYDGKIGAPEELMVPFNDRVHFFGDGCYDATVGANGKVYLLQDHLDRFFTSAKALDINIPMSKAELGRLLTDLLAKVDSKINFVYWQVTRGVEPRNHVYEEGVPGKLWVSIRPNTLNDPDKPIRLNSEEDTRFYHCNIKTLNLLPSVMTAQRAKLAGMSVMEKPFTVDFLRDADEIIVTSSSNFCLHACEFEGKPAGGKDPATLKAIQDEVLKEFYDYTGCESLWG